MPEDYQTFEYRAGSSESYKKLTLLKIPIDLKHKAFLDLGCNEGYFCFIAEALGADVTGVENNQHWHSRANDRKSLMFSSVNFVLQDWNAYLDSTHRQFDVILFSATFHYLKENQQEFLTKIIRHLRKDGLFILEAGIAPGITPEIKSIRRDGDGGTFQYPTWPMLYRMVAYAGFRSIQVIGDGLNQKGDHIPRFVIHCKI